MRNTGYRDSRRDRENTENWMRRGRGGKKGLLCVCIRDCVHVVCVWCWLCDCISECPSKVLQQTKEIMSIKVIVRPRAYETSAWRNRA